MGKEINYSYWKKKNFLGSSVRMGMADECQGREKSAISAFPLMKIPHPP